MLVILYAYHNSYDAVRVYFLIMFIFHYVKMNLKLLTSKNTDWVNYCFKIFF